MVKLTLRNVAACCCCILGLLAFNSGLAQNGETLELSSATIQVDSVDTPEEVRQIATILHDQLSIRDYDQKQGKVNYTFLDAPEQQKQALVALRTAGFQVEQVWFQGNMTITNVPSAPKVKQRPKAFHPSDVDQDGDVTTEEYTNWLKATGQYEDHPSQAPSKELHPADADGNGDVTTEEYRDYLKRQEN